VFDFDYGNKRPDLRRDCDRLRCLISPPDFPAETNDLIYEGIATGGQYPLRHWSDAKQTT